MRRCALALAAALAASCGGDSGPSTTPTPRAAPLIPLAWSSVPSHLSVRVGSGQSIRLTLTVTITASYTITSDHSRISVTSDRMLGGVLTATIRGNAAGSDTVRLTATAPGYQTAEASIPITVERLRPPPRPPTIDLDVNVPFWRELVFDAHDCPGVGSCPSYYSDGRPSAAVEERVIHVLPITSPNFYIRTHDDSGTPTFSRSAINTMRRLIPRLTQELTGDRYTGRIEEGPRRFEREGWITVEQVPFLKDDACGRAGIGWLAGLVEIAADSPCPFSSLFAHEVGHAMGFFHVSGMFELMYPSNNGQSGFTERESRHAQAAYLLGRGHRYTDGRLTATQVPDANDPPPLQPPTVTCYAPKPNP